MSPHPFRSARRRGSASLAAMIICLAGSLGLLGMISVIHARQSLIESAEDKCARRVRLLNGRQLAKEILYRRALPASEGTETTVSLGQNWGRVTIAPWTGNPYTSNSLSTIANPFSPSAGLEPFVTSLTASVFTVLDEESAWTSPETFICNLLAQNTALAGYLLDARRPADPLAASSISGTLEVNGPALIYQNPAQNNGYAFNANSVHASSSSASLSNFTVTSLARPSNFPVLPLPDDVTASGYVKGDRASVARLTGIALAEGQVIDALDSINANGILSTGSGSVSLTVGDFTAIHTVIQGDLTNLNLIGQANAAEGVAVENFAPLIIITNSTSLASVNFTGFNRRPLILAHATGEEHGSQVITYAFPAGADFRLFFIQQDAHSAFVLTDSATIRGSLFLDFGTTISGGTLTLQAEPDMEMFQYFLPRNPWLETYRQL